MLDHKILQSCLFVAEMSEFQKIVGSFIQLVDEVGAEVEKEKMKVSVIDTSDVNQTRS